jgi:hypothetical protein
MLTCVGLVKAQETPPPFNTNFKQLSTSSFYIHLPDSAIWQYKGVVFGWARLGRFKDIQDSLANYVPEARTLTINGITQDLSQNRTFTIPAGDTTNLSFRIDTLSDYTNSTFEKIQDGLISGGEATTNGDSLIVSLGVARITTSTSDNYPFTGRTFSDIAPSGTGLTRILIVYANTS